MPTVSPTPPDSAADADAVRALVRRRSAALVARDRETLEALLDPAFVYTNASGRRLGRDEYFALYVEPATLTWIAQRLDDLDVVVHGDTAVATCRVHDRARFGDDELDAHYRSTWVFARVAGRWWCLAGHTGPAEPSGI